MSNYTTDSDSNGVDILIVQECYKDDSHSGFKSETLQEFRRVFRKLRQAGFQLGFINLVEAEYEEGKKPLKKDIKEAWDRFKNTLDHIKPGTIITLGSTVTAALTGKDKFKQWVGRALDIGAYRVIPMYHPDYAKKHKQNQREYDTQVRNVVNLLQGEDDKLPTKYALVTDEEEICKVLRKCAGLTDRIQAYDWETEDLDPHKGIPICMNLSIAEGQAYVLYWYKRFGGPGLTEKVKRAVKEWLDSDVPKVAHNAKFEIKWGIVHFGVEPRNFVGDTQQMFHLLDETSKAGLKDLAYQYTDMGGYDLPMQEFLDKGNKHCDAPPDFMLPYAGGDSDCTRRVYLKLRPEIANDPGLSWMERNIINPAIFTLARLEIRGLHVDFKHVGVVEEELQRLIDETYAKINKYQEVRKTISHFQMARPKAKIEQLNLRSTDQVRHLLYKVCKLPVLKQSKKSKEASTDSKTLEELKDRHPVVSSIVEVRSYEHDLGELQVMREKRRADDTIYSDLIQDYVVTGRLSSRNPNLQNIGNESRVKETFDSRFGDLGRLLQADFEQLELRLIGSEAEDEMFMDAFFKGYDIHSATAAYLNKIPLDRFLAGLKANNKEYSLMRTAAKRINFGVVYGITKFGLSRQLSISEEACEDMLSDYWRDHPNIRRWMKQNEREAYENLCVRNRFGRIRHIPDIRSDKWWIADSAKRTASNSKIQSLGADITMWSLTKIDRIFISKKMTSIVDIQVHDSVRADSTLREMAQAATIIEDTMVHNANRTFKFLRIPLAVKIEAGQRWSDMEKFDNNKLPF